MAVGEVDTIAGSVAEGSVAAFYGSDVRVIRYGDVVAGGFIAHAGHATGHKAGQRSICQDVCLGGDDADFVSCSISCFGIAADGEGKVAVCRLERIARGVTGEGPTALETDDDGPICYVLVDVAGFHGDTTDGDGIARSAIGGFCRIIIFGEAADDGVIGTAARVGEGQGVVIGMAVFSDTGCDDDLVICICRAG